ASMGAGIAAGYCFYKTAMSILNAGGLGEDKSLPLMTGLFSVMPAFAGYYITEGLRYRFIFRNLRSSKRKSFRERPLPVLARHSGKIIGSFAALAYRKELFTAVSHWFDGKLQHEDVMFLFLFGSLTALSSLGVKVAMPFIDPKTRRTLGPMSNVDYRISKRDYDGAIKAGKLAVAIEDSMNTRLALGEAYAARGYLDQALIQYRTASRGAKDDPLAAYWGRVWRLIQRGMVAEKYRVSRRQLERNKDLRSGTTLAMLHARLNDKENMFSALEQTVKAHPTHANLHLFYALALVKEKRGKEAVRHFQEVLPKLLKDGKDWGRIGESANAVIIYQPSEFIKNAIVLKRGKREDIEAEMAMTRRMEDIIRDHPRYRTVETHLQLDAGWHSYLVMERGHGRLFAQVGETEPYLQAADFLALLHAKLPHDASAKGKRSLALNLKSRLQSGNLGLRPDLVRRVVHNYRPVYEAIRSMPFAIHRDAHTSNWMFQEDGTILTLDNEDKGVVPIGFDVASLMIGRTDGDAIMNAYWEGRHRYGPSNAEGGIGGYGEKEFQLGCYNSVISRAISFISARHSSLTPTLAMDLRRMAEEARGIIYKIQARHKGFYTQYRDEYGELQKGLTEIKHVL
ncbi:phosphotransferase, partial [Candidatus Woesearchaeota archaeon]|nr:phosphotransferase [Candidatus Woesearchaeota archaeon]